eukprot:scaffold308_cov60-Phaeocystis_antarctica.AAC.2
MQFKLSLILDQCNLHTHVIANKNKSPVEERAENTTKDLHARSEDDPSRAAAPSCPPRAWPLASEPRPTVGW